jgi:hypothetical protein
MSVMLWALKPITDRAHDQAVVQAAEHVGGPATVVHIYVELTCLSAGNLLLHDSDEVACADPNEGTTRAFSSSPLSPDQSSFEVTGAPDVSYTVRAVYENGSSVQ